MKRLRYTLFADGTSDRTLMRIIEWTLGDVLGDASLAGQFADLRQLSAPRAHLTRRLAEAVELYPCDVLFVHRDAERESLEKRVEEIGQAASGESLPVHVPVVPVRMTEAWLLIDEHAIRQAADNPNGDTNLDMPAPGRIESIPDPKEMLEDLLRRASEKSGRRLHKFTKAIEQRKNRVAEYIEDFEPLKRLSAYQTFEREAQDVVRQVLAGMAE